MPRFAAFETDCLRSVEGGAAFAAVHVVNGEVVDDVWRQGG